MKKKFVFFLLFLAGILAVLGYRAQQQAKDAAEFRGYQEQRDRLRAERQAEIDRLMPLPGTAAHAEKERTEALQKIARELERSNENKR